MSYHIIRHNLDVQGNIVLSGLVDGRDVNNDGTLLDSHTAASSNIHGVTGTIVGTTDTQTLTNKTIDASLNTITEISNSAISSSAAIDASKIANGAVSNTEFQKLNGISGGLVGTTDVQTLSNKTWGDNLNMDSNKITNLATPTNSTDAANKAYVDGIAQGIDAKESVRVKTTASLPAYTKTGSGVGAYLTADSNGALPSIDGVGLTVGNRLLIDTTGSASDVDNGIYTVTQVGDGSNPWILTRATDADEDTEVTSGMYVFVEEGSTCASCGYIVSTANDITVDTTSITFVQFTGAGQIDAVNYGNGGVGIFKEKSGNMLRFKNINAASNKITVANDTGNNEIDIDLVESNITIGNLSGAPSGTVVGTTDSQTLTNKTIDASLNTITEISNSAISSSAAIDASKIADGSVSNTEFQYLDGVTSGIQGQIDTHASLTSAHGVGGDIVGTTGTQTLSNKTLDAPIVQNNLITNSSYIEIADVSAPSNPVDGKGRLYKKTGNDGLFWKPDSAGNEIDLSNAGNALQLQGVDVNSTSPTDGEHLVYDALNSEWKASYGSKKTTHIFDDFITSSLQNIWIVLYSGSGSNVDVIDGIGGQVTVVSGTSASDYAELRVSNKTLIKSANFKVTGRFKISSTTNNTVEFGLYGDSDNLARFIYDTGASPGNWSAETISSGSSTINDTTTSATTGWHIFEIHGSDTDLKFYIDGSLKNTISTNLPSVLLRVYLRQTSKTSSSRTTTCDYIEAISDRDSS